MTDPIADLSLTARTGLPPGIAYLLEPYPAPTWRSHGNFGQLAAFWLQVHDSLREQGAQLKQVTSTLREGQIDAAGFQRQFVPQFNHFLQHLSGHHQIEDAAYFPKFRALDPRMVAGFDLLEGDHEVIHAQLVTTLDAARRMLTAMNGEGDARRFAADAYALDADRLLDLLIRHLADEEELVIPAMLEHGELSVS